MSEENGRFIVMVRINKTAQWEMAYICLSEKNAWNMAFGIEEQAKNLHQHDECMVIPEGGFDNGLRSGTFKPLKRPAKS